MVSGPAGAVVIEKAPQSAAKYELTFRVRRVIPPPDEKRFASMIVSVDPKHFNRHDMAALASKLEKEFSQLARVRVALLDDDDVAKNIHPIGAEYSIFEEALRGVYYLDRSKCGQYIQFSTRRKKPINEVEIKIKC